MSYFGIIFALIALLAWGFGDFFIQRTSRKVGITRALFYITAAASIVLLPKVWPHLFELSSHQWVVLIGSGIVILIVAILEFEAFKIGKLAVVEPIMSFELPI